MLLYIVSTPIGNLEDITLRALNILKEVDFVICEDTRQTRKIMDRYEISARLVSFFQHSSGKKLEEIIGQIRDGQKAAYVTDAGTPNISDPGSLLVKTAVENGILVIPIPGPSALTAALSASALDVSRFSFFGFPPAKKGRKKFFQNILGGEIPVVLYESSHRIIKTLQEIAEFDNLRAVEVFREMTKKFETIYRGNIENVLSEIQSKPENQKGEFVVIISNF
ncbi:MAG: 16S rRNA (cytidine(1402)-2'-O)-methyltransferase [bacterium]